MLFGAKRWSTAINHRRRSACVVTVCISRYLVALCARFLAPKYKQPVCRSISCVRVCDINCHSNYMATVFAANSARCTHIVARDFFTASYMARNSIFLAPNTRAGAFGVSLTAAGDQIQFAAHNRCAASLEPFWRQKVVPLIEKMHTTPAHAFGAETFMS